MNGTAVRTQHALLRPCRAKIPQSSGGQYSQRHGKLGCRNNCESPNRGTNQIRQLWAVSVTATFRAAAHSSVCPCVCVLRWGVFQPLSYAHNFPPSALHYGLPENQTQLKLHNDMESTCDMLECLTYLSRSSVHCLCGAKQAMAHTLISMPVWNCLFLMSHTPWIGVAIALFCKWRQPC